MLTEGESEHCSSRSSPFFFAALRRELERTGALSAASAAFDEDGAVCVWDDELDAAWNRSKSIEFRPPSTYTVSKTMNQRVYDRRRRCKRPGRSLKVSRACTSPKGKA